MYCGEEHMGMGLGNSMENSIVSVRIYCKLGDGYADVCYNNLNFFMSDIL